MAWINIPDGEQNAVIRARLNALGVNFDDFFEAVTVAERSVLQSSYAGILAGGLADGLVRGMLSGMTLYNAVVNGDFSGGTTGWLTYASTISASNKILITTGNGVNASAIAYKVATRTPVAGKCFVKATCRVKNSACTRLTINAINTTGTSLQNVGIKDAPVQDEWVTRYAIVNYDTVGIEIFATYADAATANGKVMEIDGNSGVFAIDMTALGLESLTADQMKDLCDNGYFEGLKGSDVEVQTVGKNLFDKSKTVQGRINSTTGLIEVNVGTVTSDFIRVKPLTYYTRSALAVTSRYAFYDVKGTLISYGTSLATFIVPSNAMYYRFSMGDAEAATVQLELGSTATTYEPFKQSTLSFDKPLNRLPNNISDSYALDAGVLTQNVQEYTLQARDIAYDSTYSPSYSNIDYFVVSTSTLLDYSGLSVALPNNTIHSSFAQFTDAAYDSASKIGMYATNMATTRVMFGFAKGTILGQAQAALAGTKILYQLATPVTTVLNKDLLAFENGTLYDNGLLPSYKQITTPSNLAATLTDQSQINERLEVRVDNVGYGVLRSAVETMAYKAVLAMPASTKNGLVRGTLSGMTLNNAVVNGDFSGGTTGWNALNASHSVLNKVLSNTGNGASATPSELKTGLSKVMQNSVWFFYSKVRVTNSGSLNIQLQLATSSGVNLSTAIQNSPALNNWYPLFAKATLGASADGSDGRMYIVHAYADAATANGKVMEVDGNSGVFAIDMTALGLDALTADQMKDLCDNGYFEGLKGSDVEVQTVGTNRFDKNRATLNATLTWANGSVNAEVGSIASDFIKTKPNTDYALTVGCSIFFYDINKVYLGNGELLTTTAGITYTQFTVPNDSRIAYVKISKRTVGVSILDSLQLEFGVSPTTYEPFKQSTLSIDKSLNRLPNGVADSYALDTGVFTQNVQEYTLTAGDVNSLVTGTNVQYCTILSSVFSGLKVQSGTEKDGSFIIQNFQNEIGDGAIDVLPTYSFRTTSTSLSLSFPLGTYANLAAAQTALAGTKILYQLATPVITVHNKDLLAFENGTLYDNGILPSYKQITTPSNLAGTLTDQLLINEHLEARLNRVDGEWINYTPTLAFTGTPPAAITTIARYTTIGNICHFNIHLSSADGNGATNLTITLPKTPKNNLSASLVNADEKVNATWAKLLGYIAQSGNLIAFRTFNAATDAVAWELIVTGSYEILI